MYLFTNLFIGLSHFLSMILLIDILKDHSFLNHTPSAFPQFPVPDPLKWSQNLNTK